jgi:hypothetical protein
LVFELGCLCLAIIILMLLIGTIGACFGSTVLMVFIVVLLAILAAH